MLASAPTTPDFGEQVDARPVHGSANRDASRGDMHAQMVAAYIAEYATKAAEDFGITARPMTAGDVDQLRVADHAKAILRTAASIAADAASTIEALREDADALEPDDGDDAVIEDASSWLLLTKWLHMLGFRGHFSTKSRRYSVTLGRLRGERRAWRRRHDRTTRGGAAVRRLGPDTDPADDDTTLAVLRQWTFDGVGWLTIATPPSPPPPPPAPASTAKPPGSPNLIPTWTDDTRGPEG